MTKENKKPTKDGRYREFLSIVVKSEPSQIFIHKHGPTHSIIDKNGNVSFTLTLTDIGLNRDNYLKHKSEMLSRFCINFIGEFLVRENLDQFAELLTGSDLGEQTKIINSRDHIRFGLEFRQGGLTFIFHSSLLQQILTEDFKLQVQDFV